MWVTKKNEETAREVINFLAEREYTVAEAKEILRFIEVKISSNATVQKANEPLFD